MNVWTVILSHPLMYRTGETLLHVLWQGVVIGLVAGALLLVLRRRSSQVRDGTPGDLRNHHVQRDQHERCEKYSDERGDESSITCTFVLAGNCGAASERGIELLD